MNDNQCPLCGGPSRTKRAEEDFAVRRDEDVLAAIMRFTGASFPDAVRIVAAARTTA